MIKFVSSKQVFVTGADGFVGSYLLENLSAEYHVSGSSRNRKGTGTLVQLDLEAVGDAGEALFKGFDVLVHCAGVAHNKGGREKFFKVNTKGTKDLVKKAIREGIRHIVYISSMSVYDDRAAEVIITPSCREAPQSEYGISKLRAEEAAAALCGEAGVALSIIRPAMLVGRDAPGNLALLKKYLLLGFPFLLPRRENRRSFMDLHSLNALIASEIKRPPRRVRTIIGWSFSCSLEEMVKIMADVNDVQLRIVRIPLLLVKTAMNFPVIGRVARKLYGDYIIDSSTTETSGGPCLSASFEKAILDHG